MALYFDPIESISGACIVKGLDCCVKSFSKTLKQTDSGSVVGIYGSWGQGKSSFLHMLKDYITSNEAFKDYHVIFIPLINYEKAMNIPYTISKAVCDSSTGTGGKTKRYLKLLGEETFSVLSMFLRSFKLKFKGAEFEVKEDSDDFKRIESDIKSKLFLKEDDALAEISALCSMLAGIKNKGIKIVVCFDDLDRCDPSFSRIILEELKLFFNMLNCHFVFAVNPVILHQSIKAYFKGQNYDDPEKLALTYFDKFIDYHIDLPQMSLEDAGHFIDAVTGVRQELEITNQEKWTLLSGIPLNPRAIKRFLLRYYYEKQSSEGNVEKIKICLLKFMYPKIVEFAQQYPFLYKKFTETAKERKYDINTIQNLRSELYTKPYKDAELVGIINWIMHNYPFLFGFLNSQPVVLRQKEVV